MKGYSLIEIVLVICIIGIIAGFLSFRFSGITDQIKLQSSARQIISELRSAQMKAVSGHNDQEIIFSDDHYIVAGRERKLPSSVFILSAVTVKFSPSGMPYPGYFGTIKLLCHDRSVSIIISNIGRIRVE